MVILMINHYQKKHLIIIVLEIKLTISNNYRVIINPNLSLLDLLFSFATFLIYLLIILLFQIFKFINSYHFIFIFS